MLAGNPASADLLKVVGCREELKRGRFAAQDQRKSGSTLTFRLQLGGIILTNGTIFLPNH